MSQQDVDVVRRFFQLFDDGKLTEIEALLTDDFEWIYHGPPSLPWAGTYQGVEGFRRFFTIVRQWISVEVCQPYDFLDAGDRVVVLGFSRTRVLHNAARYEAQWMNVFTIRDGLIARYLDLYDTASMVEALHREPA
ncbi:nuclear transport factor 2 family protein [Micromonospora sp. PLK6-60]|uniref:nuclear transport factor 2 family protein n=1 Tax=Micromonospora sp. PLK6-60 TaxID=2873383 RepID=UPI001CA73D57|nr:nuclear transport factor 2 family protein [Micromonospora sp. PLK6-60]MBY8875064.1 nuclear transport factor 2 family protein [Micromonospora sp. PLK6-60]